MTAGDSLAVSPGGLVQPPLCFPSPLRERGYFGGLTCRSGRFARVCSRSPPGLLAQNVNGRDTWLHL